MRNVLLTISYDGTDFHGWQRQDSADVSKPVRTVQGEIERVLEKIHKQSINLFGSGRTDSGVHAFAQAANFFSPIDSIPVEKYIPALNSLLPDDIRIMEAKIVPEAFNARFSATSRTYRYFFHTKTPPANQMRFVWPVYHRPDITVLNEMASFMKNEIDCASFASSGDQSVSTCRYIEKAHFFYDEKDNDILVFEITANAFLWKMVRSLAGTFISFEKSGKSPEYFKKVLDSKDRSMAGPTAPPAGLFLYRIRFDGTRIHI